MTLIEQTVEKTPMRALIQRWEGHAVVTQYDRPTGTWMFIALHSTRLGTPSGGTRLRVYDSPDEGLADAMRLAEGMTFKWAAIDFPAGGGKAVLAVPRPLVGEEREGLFRRFGSLVESLRGGFSTGADYGTTPADMGVVRRVTRHVHGVGEDGHPVVDGGYYTALGVIAGIRAAVKAAFGSDALAGRSVLVQGVGEVGRPLVDLLAAAGARLFLADLDAARLERAARRAGAAIVPAAEVATWAGDVYSPCAVGSVLNERTVSALRARVVAGCANNQLETPQDAARLHARGILYAPDFVINSGAALVFGLFSKGVCDPGELVRRVDTIGELLSEIFDEARAGGESPDATAVRRVERTLERGPHPFVG